MTKRDANKQFNRKAILDAARKVFAQEGFSKANITQVIETSGLSTGTFYNYFQTKDELMEELSLLFLHQLRELLVTSAPALEKQGLEVYIDHLSQAISQLLQEHPEDIALITSNQIYFRHLLLHHPKWVRLVQNITHFIEQTVTIKEEAALISQIILGAFVVMLAYKNNHADIEASVVSAFMKKYLHAAFKGFT